MGKNKNKSVYLSCSDRTIIGTIATLHFPKHLMSKEQQQTAPVIIRELLHILSGKAHRVARCVLDTTYQDSNKVHNAANTFIIWAKTL